MGLLRKFFGDRDGDASSQDSGTDSSQFHESEATSEQPGSRNAPRRELVQVVLRDTMRLHGIPSDWIECRVLSVVSRSRLTGMHVTFIVREGEDRLIGYVHAFQESFMREIEKYEPRASDWLFSVSWQFTGRGKGQPRMPDPEVWVTPGQGAGHDDLEADLQALYAIRDAAIKDVGRPQYGHADFEPTRPGE